MTTGEYLVSHSSLPTGTALAHLLALQVGTGLGETVFASKSFVRTSQEEFVATATPGRAIREARVFSAIRSDVPGKSSIYTRRERAVCNTGIEKVFLLRRSKKI